MGLCKRCPGVRNPMCAECDDDNDQCDPCKEAFPVDQRNWGATRRAAPRAPRGAASSSGMRDGIRAPVIGWNNIGAGHAAAAVTALNVSQTAVPEPRIPTNMGLVPQVGVRDIPTVPRTPLNLDAVDDACATVLRAVRSIATCCRCSNGFADGDIYFEGCECDSQMHYSCIHAPLPCKRQNMPRAPRTISEAVARVDALQAEARQNVENSCAGAVGGSSDEDRANSLRGKHYYHRKAKREKHDAEGRSTASGSNPM